MIRLPPRMAVDAPQPQGLCLVGEGGLPPNSLTDGGDQVDDLGSAFKWRLVRHILSFDCRSE
jgi:hypothetical protein